MADALTLFDLQSNEVGKATLRAGEVIFEDPTHRWVWILDARHEPYDTLTLTEIISRAAAARKRYALVGHYVSDPSDAVEAE